MMKNDGKKGHWKNNGKKTDWKNDDKSTKKYVLTGKIYRKENRNGKMKKKMG